MSIKTMETMSIVFMWMTMIAVIGCMFGMTGSTTIAAICIALGFKSLVTSLIIRIRIFKYYETH